MTAAAASAGSGIGSKISGAFANWGKSSGSNLATGAAATAVAGPTAGAVAGPVGTGALFAGGAAVANDAAVAMRDYWTWVMLGGFLLAFMKVIFRDPSLAPLYTMFSLVLLVLCFVSLSEKKDAVTTIFLGILSLVLVSLFDFGIGLIALLFVLSLFGYDLSRHFNALAGEAKGLWLLFTFFLSIFGLANVLGFFGLPLNNQMIIEASLFMPWFLAYGAWNSRNPSVFVGIARILTLLWVLFLFVGVVDVYVEAIPFLDNLGSIEDLQEGVRADLEFREQHDGKAPGALFAAQCFYDSFTQIGQEDPLTYDECIDEREFEWEIANTCEADLGYVEEVDPDGYATCLDEQRSLQGNQEAFAVGGVDDEITAVTDLQIIPDITDAQNKVFQQVGVPAFFVVDLVYENPSWKESEVFAEISCSFVPSYGRGEVIEGVVSGASSFALHKEMDDDLEVVCSTPDGVNLDGTYTMEVTALLSGLETSSRLDLLYVDEYVKGDSLIEDAIADNLPRQQGVSLAANEYVRLNLNVDEAVVEVGDIGEESSNLVVLRTSIENVGPGTITGVHEYDVNTGSDLAFVEGSSACLSSAGSELYFPEVMRPGQVFPMGVCFLEADAIVEDALALPYVPRSYDAHIAYTYELTESLPGLEFVLLGESPLEEMEDEIEEVPDEGAAAQV